MYMENKDIVESVEHKNILTRLSKTLCDRFDSKVKKKGLTRSEVVRMLMDQYVEAEDRK